MNFRTSYLREAAGIAAIAIAWIVLVNVGGSMLLRSLYGSPLLDGLILGPSVNPLDHYLTTWNTLAWTALPAVVLFSVIAIWRGRPGIGLLLLLLLATWVRVPGLLSRSMTADESYTLIEAAGHAPPPWPTVPFQASSVKYVYEGSAPLGQITETLREIDVHPPFYYWAVSIWRRAFGFSLEATRTFSLVCSIGTIVALYLLLRAARIQNPLVPTLIYGMSAYAVFSGGLARNYAMGSFLITVGAWWAYLAVDTSSRSKRRALGWSIAAALCCGAAFQTHYFALFPISAVLLWLFVYSWPKLRFLAFAPPLAAIAVGLFDLAGLLQKLGARPGQQLGFLGYFRSAKAIFEANLRLLWQPLFEPVNLLPLEAGVGLLLLAATAWLVTRRENENRRLWTLLLGLASAPSLGVYLFDLTGKHFHHEQYVSFAGPALATLVAYPIARLYGSRWRWGVCALSLMWMTQMLSVNLGLDDTKYRTAARTIARTWSPSQLVVIDAGCSDSLAGCGFQYSGALIYELHPRTKIVTFGDDTDLEALLSLIYGHEDVWVGFGLAGLRREPNDGARDAPEPLAPTDIRKRLLRHLQTTTCYSLELTPGVEPELYHLKALRRPPLERAADSPSNELIETCQSGGRS